MPERRRISTTPFGVQGTNDGSPSTMRPTFVGWKPSTSLAGSMASMTSRSMEASGSGSCTRMPSMASSAFSARTAARISSRPARADKWISREWMPAAAQAFSLAVDIGTRSRIVAHQHHAQTRHTAGFRLHRRDGGGDFRAQVGGQGFSIQDAGAHAEIPSRNDSGPSTAAWCRRTNRRARRRPGFPAATARAPPTTPNGLGFLELPFQRRRASRCRPAWNTPVRHRGGSSGTRSRRRCGSVRAKVRW